MQRGWNTIFDILILENIRSILIRIKDIITKFVI